MLVLRRNWEKRTGFIIRLGEIMREEKCWICDGIGYFENKDDDNIIVYHLGCSNIENSTETMTRKEYRASYSGGSCSCAIESSTIICSTCRGSGIILFLEDEDLEEVC